MIESIICLNSAPNMSAKAEPTPAGTTQLLYAFAISTNPAKSPIPLRTAV